MPTDGQIFPKARTILLIFAASLLPTIVFATSAPANDNFADSAVLSGTSCSALAYDRDATLEPGEPNHAGYGATRSLWWSWTAPYTGWASFSTYGSSGSTVMAVYTGNTLAMLSALGVVTPHKPPSNYNARTDYVAVPVQKDTVYHIAIAGLADTAGTSRRIFFGINQAPVVTSASSISGQQGVSFSYQVRAANGVTSFAATNLPPGLVIDPVTGLISGTPTGSGKFETTLNVSGPSGVNSAIVHFDFQTATAAVLPVFSDTSGVINGYVGYPLSSGGFEFSFTPQTATVSADTLPPGLTLQQSSGGGYVTISGTPTSAGAFETTLTAQTSDGIAHAKVKLQILEKPPLPWPSNAAVAYATVGSSFNDTFSEYGVASFADTIAWTVGSLPDGLYFQSGRPGYSSYIGGTPTTAGTYEIPVTATGAGGSVSSTLTIVVAPAATDPTASPTPTGAPVLTSASGALTTVGASFSFQVSATSSPTQYSAANLPPGLSINPSTGRISGIPTTRGAYEVTLTAANGVGTGQATLLIGVHGAPPKITSSALAIGTVNKSFSYTIGANWDYYYDPSPISSPLTFQFQASDLPPGLSLSPSSVTSSSYIINGAVQSNISGTPTMAGTYKVPITVSCYGLTTNAVLTIIVAPDGATAAALPTIGLPLTFSSLIGEYSSYPVTFGNSPTQIDALALPSGFNLDTAGRRFLGYPPFNVSTASLHVTNAAGETSAQINFIAHPSVGYWTLFAPPANLYLTFGQPSTQGTNLLPDSQPAFLQGQPYVAAPTVPLTASIRGLPPGLYFDSRSTRYGFNNVPFSPSFFSTQLRIEGTPTVSSGDFPIDLVASTITGDLVTHSVIHLVPGVIDSNLTISSSYLLNTWGAVGADFQQTIVPTGRATSVGAEGLPPGLSLTVSDTTAGSAFTKSATISGQPTQAGTYPVRFTFSNENHVATFVTTIVVLDTPLAPALSRGISARGVVDQPFNYAFSPTTGAYNPVATAEATNLPPGLTFHPENQTITGVPAQAGEFFVPYHFSNAGGDASGTLTITITGSASAPHFQTVDSYGTNPNGTLPATEVGFLNTPFDLLLNFSNDLASADVGGLPAGLRALTSQVNGVWSTEIKGTPTQAGSFPITVTAKNAQGTTISTVNLEIRHLDQIAATPTTDQPPAPNTLPAPLDLKLPSKTTITKGAVTIRGHVLNYLPGAEISLRAGKGSGWKHLRVTSSGAFKIHLSNLPVGTTKVLIRTIDSSGRTTITRLKVHRKSA